MKFKVGDRVKVVHGDKWNLQDEEGIIKSIVGETYHVWYPSQRKWWWARERRLELAESLKVGDKAEITDEKGCPLIEKWCKEEVIRIGGDSVRVIVWVEIPRKPKVYKALRIEDGENSRIS